MQQLIEEIVHLEMMIAVVGEEKVHNDVIDVVMEIVEKACLELKMLH
jgi:hypothetical protein